MQRSLCWTQARCCDASGTVVGEERSGHTQAMVPTETSGVTFSPCSMASASYCPTQTHGDTPCSLAMPASEVRSYTLCMNHLFGRQGTRRSISLENGASWCASTHRSISGHQTIVHEDNAHHKARGC